ESGDIPGDHHALDVLPWSLADAVARIDGGLAVGGLRREIGVPDLGGAKTRRLRQRLAVVVGAGDAAEIAAIADATAGQEERGIGGLRRSWRGRQKSECNGDAGRDGFCGRAHLLLHLAACGWGFAVILGAGTALNPRQQGLFRRGPAMSTNEKGAAEPRRPCLATHPMINWSAGSPKASSCRRAAARRSRPRWLPPAARCR